MTAAQPRVWRRALTAFPTFPALDRWSCLCNTTTQVAPPPRTGHSASYAQGQLVVYGGRDAVGELLRDVWVFDTCACLRVQRRRRAAYSPCPPRAVRIAWRKVDLIGAVQPRPRAGHAAVLRPTSPLQLSLLGAPRRATCAPGFRRVLRRPSAAAFGGASGTVVLDDVWQLSVAYDPLFQNVTGNWTAIRESDSVELSSGAPGVWSAQRRLLLALPALLLLCAL